MSRCVLRRARLAVALLTAALFAPACTRPLPEAGSKAAAVYQQRCGNCHAAYHPALLSRGMWELMVRRMEDSEMAAAGEILDGADRREILAYLRRNAGGSQP